MSYRFRVLITSREGEMKKAFAATKDSFAGTFYCSIASLPPDQQKYTPVAEWAAANNYTVAQCRTLLRRKQLLGFQFRGRFYVCPNPTAIIRQNES